MARSFAGIRPMIGRRSKCWLTSNNSRRNHDRDFDGRDGNREDHYRHAALAADRVQYAEGDDYHSEANKAKMHAGIPLTDEDRAPWLAVLHELLYGWFQKGESGILACSALKQSYRDTLTAGIAHEAYRFVLLKVSPEHIAERLSHRPNHY